MQCENIEVGEGEEKKLKQNQSLSFSKAQPGLKQEGNFVTSLYLISVLLLLCYCPCRLSLKTESQ